MKIPVHCLVFLILAAAPALRADPAPTPASVPKETFMIVDLEKPLSEVFQYGTWDGKIAVTKSGMLVLGAKGAQGKGGFGREIAPALDCSAMNFVEVALGVVAGNEVPAITVALNDADGTQYAARINLDNLVPGQPVWVRARREDFRLNDIERGSDSKMDWSKVARWHVQGDWMTDKPMQVMFIALRGRR